jgi:hypothetical protein
MTFDPSEQIIIQKNLVKVRIFWFANLISWAIIYFIISSLKFSKVTDQPMVKYVLALLAAAELIVIVLMRRIRLKPALLKTLSDRGIGEIGRNFFMIDLITICLMDSIIIYGIIGYIMLGDLKMLNMYSIVTVVGLLYFFPRESTWTRNHDDSMTSS